MEIEVKLYSIFMKYLPPGEKGPTFKVDLPDDATVGDLLTKINFTPGIPKVSVVKGQSVKDDHRLQNGEMVSFMPPLAGG